MDNELIRRIVVEELQNRLEPLTHTVSRLDRTVRSLYSNGSGGPPGFLETARSEDNDRFDRLFDSIKELNGNRDIVNAFMLISKDREDRNKRTRKNLMKIGIPVIAGIFSLMGILAKAAYDELSPFARYLVEDYMQYHPHGGSQKTTTGSSKAVLSSVQKP
jgi:hypothetical protein